MTLPTDVLTRDGFVFKGWAPEGADVSGGTGFTAPGGSYTPTGDVTLVAVWEPMTRRVKYDAGKGADPPDASFVAPAAANALYAESGGTYTLDGSKTTGVVTAGLPKTFSYALPVQAAEGYTFKGWSGPNGAGGPWTQFNVGPVDLFSGDVSEVTLEGVWSANAYDLTITGDSTISSITAAGYNTAAVPGGIKITADYQATVSITATPASGYGQSYTWGKTGPGDFTAASTTQTVSYKMGAGAATIAVTAAGNEFTVRFDANGGGGMQSGHNVMHTYNDGFTLPACTYAPPYRKQFSGWSTKADGTGASYAVGAAYMPTAHNETVTFFAQWADVVLYDVTFAKDEHVGAAKATFNGADVDFSKPLKMAAGETASLDRIQAERGYHATGWTVAGSGSFAPDAGATSGTYTAGAGAATVTAMAAGNSFTVSFAAGGGTGEGPQEATCVYGTDAFSLPECMFAAPEGKIFATWTDAHNYEYAPGTEYVPVDDGEKVVFTPKWINKTISVTVQIADAVPSDRAVFWGDSSEGYAAGTAGASAVGARVRNLGNSPARLAELRVYDAGAADLLGVDAADGAAGPEVFSLTDDKGVKCGFGFRRGREALKVDVAGAGAAGSFTVPAGGEYVAWTYGCELTADDVDPDKVGAVLDESSYVAPLAKVVYVFEAV